MRRKHFVLHDCYTVNSCEHKVMRYIVVFNLRVDIRLEGRDVIEHTLYLNVDCGYILRVLWPRT